MKKIIILAFISALLIVQPAILARAEGGMVGPDVIPFPSQPSPPPPMDPIVKENIELAIDLIEQMGFPQKAAAAREMLKKNLIVVGDVKAHGYCDSWSGVLIIDIDDIHPWHVTNLKNESIRKNSFVHERNVDALLAAAITVYHELVHCLQQSAPFKAASGVAYTLTLGDQLAEIEAHGKDIQFASDLVDRLDEIYRKLFNKKITPALKEKIMKELAASVKESYQSYNKYQKPTWVKDIVFYSTAPGRTALILKAVKKAGAVLREAIKYTEPPRPDPPQSITETDKDLGFLKRRKDYYEFTSTDWLENVANIYNRMKDSAFKTLVGNCLGKRTNLNFLYEDGEVAVAGLEKLANGTLRIQGEAMANPTANLNISRLAVADLLDAGNFYQAVLGAYEEGKIKFEPKSPWERIKYFVYGKIVLPFQKDAIKSAVAEEILPRHILENWEDLLVSPVLSAPASLESAQPQPAVKSSAPPPVAPVKKAPAPADKPAIIPAPVEAPVSVYEEEEAAVCGNNKLEFMETCDGDKFSQQCLDGLEDYKKIYNNPNLTLRCFNNCRGCENSVPGR